MEQIAITKLKPHPMNSQFFDDMTGDSWAEFLESIKTSGVIEPIIATTNYVVVSGHQRLRACKELGIKEVPVVLRFYADDDAILKDLIETNIRQRGMIGGSQVKLGRRIKELERIYGVRQGSSNEKGAPSGSIGTSREYTQSDLANQLGIDLNTLKRAKQLTDLPQEIQDMVESGKITPSTASRVIARLSPDEQLQLIEELPAKEKFTQKEIVDLTDKLKAANDKIGFYESDIQRLSEANNDLRKELETARTKQPQPKTIDYDYQCLLFLGEIDSFLKEIGGYAYLGNRMKQVSELNKKQYIKAIQTVQAWAVNLLNSLEDENE